MKTVSGKHAPKLEHEIIPEAIPLSVLLKDQSPDHYPMTFNFEFVVGEEKLVKRDCPPIVTFRAHHLVSNIREPGIACLKLLQVANVSCLLADELDLCSLPETVETQDPILGCSLSLPWITPSNQFHLWVQYSGRIPTGFKKGETFTVGVTLVGESRLTY